MHIYLIAIGQRMPGWIVDGFVEYQKRLPPHFTCELIELPAQKRAKNADIEKIREQESNVLLSHIPAGSLVIALDENGRQWPTEELATQFAKWEQEYKSISLLIGGPDGLSANCLQRAAVKWSLSKMTLPHPLVRIIVIEQIYRVFSILSSHPYHR